MRYLRARIGCSYQSWQGSSTRICLALNGLKVLPEAFTCDTERMVRFQREAKVLASLNPLQSPHSCFTSARPQILGSAPRRPEPPPRALRRARLLRRQAHNPGLPSKPSLEPSSSTDGPVGPQDSKNFQSFSTLRLPDAHATKPVRMVAVEEAVSDAAREDDPLMRPFAKSLEIYPAIQANPTMLDYVARRMQRSPHP